MDVARRGETPAADFTRIFELLENGWGPMVRK